MRTKLSTSAPPYSQWVFPTHYQPQPQHQLQHQTQQLIMPKQEIDYSSSFISGHTIHHHHPQHQMQQQQQQQQQQVHLLQQQTVHPPQIHLEEGSGELDDVLPSAEDLLGDPMLRPLGIEPMPPVDHQHLISPYCTTPLFGSSILGSPLSASSLLNTPVATPGKLSSNDLVQPAVVEGHVESHHEVPEAPVVAIKPDPEPSPNESYIQRVSNKNLFLNQS
jgi:hypothetical protein